jgi:hypothetical protein
LVNEVVCTSDEKDIGDVFAINKFFLVVKEGFINTHYYCIAMVKVEGWDGYPCGLKKDQDSNYERCVH